MCLRLKTVRLSNSYCGMEAQFVKTGCFFDFTFIMFDVLINEGLRF